MAGPMADEGSTYSLIVGLIYTFNLIVGTGALALPKAFQAAGYILGSATLVVSCFVSYLGATFVIESMAVVNALNHDKNPRAVPGETTPLVSSDDESTLVTGQEVESVLDKQFTIKKRYELSQMGRIILGRWGFIFFQLCLIIYLYGDLAVYCTVVPKSLMTVVCTYTNDSNNLGNESILSNGDPCFENTYAPSRINIYRIFVIIFVLLLGPFVFFGVTKTKYLQMFTSLARWLAFILLIVLGSLIIGKGEGTGRLPPAEFSGFGSIFGIACYAFICHHSLPSVITPIRKKRGIHFYIIGVYILILLFYATLAFTGSYAFKDLQDVYTLNFVPPNLKREGELTAGKVLLLLIDYFLSLFPVVALTANFPIVGITLRNNLRALFDATLPEPQEEVEKEEEKDEEPQVIDEVDDTLAIAPVHGPPKWRLGFRSYIIPLAVILPPLFIAIGTDNVEALASITGSYGGVAIQFVLPSLLVYFARKKIGRPVPKSLSSPLKGAFWPALLILWSIVTIVVVTITRIIE